MRVLRAEPTTRAKPTAPFSVAPANLLALYAIRRHQPRIDLGEVRLREPAEFVDQVRKRVATELAEYPLRRIPAKSPRRLAQTLLRWSQRLLLLLGLLGVGTWGWFYAQARVFQVYQSWRLDQLVKHRPAELKAFLEGYLARIEMWMTDGTPPPVAVPVPTKSPSPSPVPPSPPPVEGSLIGRMEIPRLALSTVILEGDSNPVLRKAAGHIPGTALPGAAGNVAIAGHRDTFFRALRRIRNNDVIALETTAGTYHYRVDSTDIVAPDDVQVLKPTDHPSLTLVTCYPFYYVGSAPKRYIVSARLIKSSPIESPPTASLGSQPKPPWREDGFQAPEKSPGQASSSYRARLAHPVARRRATPRQAHRPAAQSSSRKAPTPLGDEEQSALSVPPADTHKPSGLRRRALVVPKRFASWFRSFPKRSSKQ